MVSNTHVGTHVGTNGEGLEDLWGDRSPVAVCGDSTSGPPAENGPGQSSPGHAAIPTFGAGLPTPPISATTGLLHLVCYSWADLQSGLLALPFTLPGVKR